MSKYNHKDPSGEARVQIEQFCTEQTLLRVTRVIPRHLLRLDIRHKPMLSEVGDDMLLDLEACLQKKDKALDVPLTWWDHFKLTHFPSWLLKRFPAKYRTIDVRALFPHLPAEITDRARCFTYLKKEE